ncbi:MAG: SDR family oxidoreductase, partial [Bacteroidales bacterium]|nr:SDR family oxidoreductase [Bacteroidales bacterium]
SGAVVALYAIFNNATTAPLGPADTVSINDWDKSYYVNFRAPVLLIQKFLPDMKKNNEGIIIFVPSSGAAPYMGAYEVFKTSQVELCNTLVGELENTNIITYSIGPGLVNTATAQKGIETVANLMNISIEEFYKINEKQIIDAETAGTGFAVSVALANKYNGQEISSMQALMDAKVFSETPKEASEINLCDLQYDKLKLAVSSVLNTFFEQSNGWLNRNVFERQWILRDFKKTIGISIDEINNEMQQISKANEEKNYSFIANKKSIFEKIQKYYERQIKLLQGYEKDPQKLKDTSEIIISWIGEIKKVLNYIK